MRLRFSGVKSFQKGGGVGYVEVAVLDCCSSDMVVGISGVVPESMPFSQQRVGSG